LATSSYNWEPNNNWDSNNNWYDSEIKEENKIDYLKWIVIGAVIIVAIVAGICKAARSKPEGKFMY